MQSGDKAYVILVGAQGRIRVEHPSAFLGRGVGLVGTVEGERLTTWSGSTPSSLLPEVKK
jgi:zona occludens toxin